MCDVYDVLEASTGHAAEMVTSVYEYGGNNLGAGIRRLASDMLTVGTQIGYEQAATELAPIAFDEGHMAGWCQGFESGRLEGMLKGSLITLAVTGVLGLTAWGIKKYVEHKNAQPQAIPTAEGVSSEQKNGIQHLQEQ